MFFDPVYFIFLAPALLLTFWAQFRIKSTYAEASQIPSARRITGREAALTLLARNGIQNVAVEATEGTLTDHYDPTAKVLRLSHDVYYGSSLAAVGIAAHEAGHAIQDKVHYAPLRLRNGIVPLASIGSNLSFFLLALGLGMNAVQFILLGIALFSIVVIFQLVNLPVEFDASRRAREHLVTCGIVSPAEEREVRSVLGAAALTYVAATLTAVMTLVYYLFRAGFLGNRSDE